MSTLEALEYMYEQYNRMMWSDKRQEIDAVLAEARKQKTIVDAAPQLLAALEGLVNDVKRKPNDTRYATHIKIAEDVIKTINLK